MIGLHKQLRFSEHAWQQPWQQHRASVWRPQQAAQQPIALPWAARISIAQGRQRWSIERTTDRQLLHINFGVIRWGAVVTAHVQRPALLQKAQQLLQAIWLIHYRFTFKPSTHLHSTLLK